MDKELIGFLNAMLEADLHNVVAIQSFAPHDVDVLLESTVPMLDGVRAVVDLYAATEDRRPPVPGGDSAFDTAFALGRAAGIEEAVRHLAVIYHDDPRFRTKWLPSPAHEGSRDV